MPPLTPALLRVSLGKEPGLSWLIETHEAPMSGIYSLVRWAQGQPTELCTALPLATPDGALYA